MLRALFAKFDQHESIRRVLLQTKNRRIIAKFDHNYWGTGIDGKGFNMQGRLLEIVRNNLSKKNGKDRKKLKHKTLRGDWVRSKSETIIANLSV